MADITIKCGSCGEQTTVSEYIDAEAALCKACGASLKLPRKAASKKPRAPEVSKKRDDADDMVLSSPKDSDGKYHERNTVTAAVAVNKRAKKRRGERKMLVWSPSRGTMLGIFLTMTIILSLLKYTGILGDADREMLIKAGMFMLGVGWIAIVVDAFQDHIMHGLLSLAIPPYAIWYLFAQCDSFILRIGVGVLLIPFGPDMAVLFWHSLIGVIRWLGGTHTEYF